MDLDERINEFEEKYASRVRRWAGLVDPNELDQLIETLAVMEEESKAITGLFRDEKDPLYQSRWLPLLKGLMSQIPSIGTHLEKIRKESRTGLDLMDRGKKGLTGYRKGVERKRVIFDEDA